MRFCAEDDQPLRNRSARPVSKDSATFRRTAYGEMKKPTPSCREVDSGESHSSERSRSRVAGDLVPKKSPTRGSK